MISVYNSIFMMEVCVGKTSSDDYESCHGDLEFDRIFVKMSKLLYFHFMILLLIDHTKHQKYL